VRIFVAEVVKAAGRTQATPASAFTGWVSRERANKGPLILYPVLEVQIPQGTPRGTAADAQSCFGPSAGEGFFSSDPRFY
jgi:hypothetical protein